MVRRSQQGFTLIETMVVLAIAVVLAAIAYPLYTDSVVYTRQKEAKVALSSIYAAEAAFFAEWLSYTLCLRQIGYVPGAGLNGAGDQIRWYRTGFLNGADPNTCGYRSNFGGGPNRSCLIWDFTPGRVPGDVGAVPLAGNPCVLNNDGIFAETSGYAPDISGIVSVMGRTTFTAGAAGMINPSRGLTDAWTIDQGKVLKYIKAGF